MNKKEKIVMTSLGFLALIVILWLAYRDDKNKEALVEKDSQNNGLKNSLTDMDNQRNYWQNAYLSQSTWLQHFQHIPHPKDTIKQIIQNLEKIKSDIFREQPDFIKEIDSAIHSLKGEKLSSSFAILAKIVENLLEQSFIENPKFCERYKRKIDSGGSLNLGIFVDFVIQESYFEGEDAKFLRQIKNLRNDFVHEISPKIDENILIGLHLKIIETIEFVVFEPWSKDIVQVY